MPILSGGLYFQLPIPVVDGISVLMSPEFEKVLLQIECGASCKYVRLAYLEKLKNSDWVYELGATIPPPKQKRHQTCTVQ